MCGVFFFFFLSMIEDLRILLKMINVEIGISSRLYRRTESCFSCFVFFESRWWKELRQIVRDRHVRGPKEALLYDRLVGLVVKASAPRAEDPGFKSRLSRDFFGVESYQ